MVILQTLSAGRFLENNSGALIDSIAYVVGLVLSMFDEEPARQVGYRTLHVPRF